jgi:hypothetical protein
VLGGIFVATFMRSIIQASPTERVRNPSFGSESVG